MGTMRSTVTDEITRASDPGASRRRLPGERGLRSAACLLVCGLVQIASVARGQGTLPPDCAAVPAGSTFASPACRTAALLAQVTASTGLGRQQAKLRQRLEKATALREQAVTARREPKLRRTRKRLARAVKQMAQVGKTLRSRQARRSIPDALTVADGNRVLDAAGAGIVMALENVPLVLVRIPDPGSVAALDGVVASLAADPAVVSVAKAGLDEVDVLGDNFAPPPAGAPAGSAPDWARSTTTSRCVPPPRGTYVAPSAPGGNRPSSWRTSSETGRRTWPCPPPIRCRSTSTRRTFTSTDTTSLGFSRGASAVHATAQPHQRPRDRERDQHPGAVLQDRLPERDVVYGRSPGGPGDERLLPVQRPVGRG